MRKHQETISQGVQAFDEKVMKLFQLKVETEKTVLEVKTITIIIINNKLIIVVTGRVKDTQTVCFFTS